MSRKRLIITLLCAVAAFVFVFSAYARAQILEPKTVIVAGQTTGAGTAAINAALDNAVLAVMAETLPPEVFKQNFTHFAQHVLKDSGAYVQSYKILAEGAVSGGTHAVIEATVLPEQIKLGLENAGLLAQAGMLSSVAILVDANSVFNPEIQQWWRLTVLPDELALAANSIGNALGEQGYIYTPAAQAHQRASQAIRNNFAPLDNDLVVVGQALNADALILGSVTFTSRQDRSVMGNYHIRAVADLRIMEVSTGKTLCTVTAEGGAVSDDQDFGQQLAMMEMAQNAATELAKCLSTQAAPQVSAVVPEAYTGGVSKITVTVTGQDRKMSDFINFRQTVSSMSGVSDMKVNSMGSDGLRITFNYNGTTQMLMSNIADFNFPNYTAKMTENGKDFIKYEISTPDDVPQFEISE